MAETRDPNSLNEYLQKYPTERMIQPGRPLGKPKELKSRVPDAIKYDGEKHYVIVNKTQQLRDDLQMVQEHPKSATTQKNCLTVKVDRRPPPILLTTSTPAFKNYLDVEFDDVIAEPEGTHSDKCVWRNAKYLFTCSKNCCYRTLTLICALPIAFVVGCSFACLTFQHVWCIGPALRQFASNCYAMRQFLSKALDSCIGPCCAAIGLLCSRIRIAHNNERNSGV